MLGINNYIPIRVLTQRGILPMDKINPGDKVYEYRTGNLLEVRHVGRRRSVNLQQVTYTDRRVQIYDDQELIFTGTEIVPVKESTRTMRWGSIKTYPVECQTMTATPFPDPYVMGAFYILANFSDPYINIPFKRWEANPHIFHKYNMEQYDVNGKGFAHFAWQHDTSHPVTWEEMFPYNRFWAGRDKGKIPFDFVARIKDRKQFLRGVFDVAYETTGPFPRRVGLVSIHLERLKEIQHVLWSLGILADVSFHYPGLGTPDQYSLIIRGKYSDYPGFFYNTEELVHMLKQSTINFLYEPLTLAIDDIDVVQRGYRWSRGVMCNLYLEKEKALYLDENFLPRVSK